MPCKAMARRLVDLCRGMDLKAAVVDWVSGGKKQQECPG